MNRRQVNNAVLALAIGALTVGLAGTLPNIDLPDVPWPTPTPTDPPGPLAAMVAEEHRPRLVQFFNDLAAVVEADSAGVLATTEQVRQAQNAASTLLVQAGQWPANAQLRSELMRRQESAFGLESQPVTPELRARIVAFYRQVAEDF